MGNTSSAISSGTGRGDRLLTLVMMPERWTPGFKAPEGGVGKGRRVWPQGSGLLPLKHFPQSMLRSPAIATRHAATIKRVAGGEAWHLAHAHGVGRRVAGWVCLLSGQRQPKPTSSTQCDRPSHTSPKTHLDHHRLFGASSEQQSTTSHENQKFINPDRKNEPLRVSAPDKPHLGIATSPNMVGEPRHSRRQSLYLTMLPVYANWI